MKFDAGTPATRERAPERKKAGLAAMAEAGEPAASAATSLLEACRDGNTDAADLGLLVAAWSPCKG